MLRRNIQTCENEEEKQYLNLINDIISKGSLEKGRNGNTYVIIGAAMHFSLENNSIPLLTTKKVAWKTCLKELLWFVRGQTNNKILTEQKCNIWKGNASREFLDSRGLVNNEDNDCEDLDFNINIDFNKNKNITKDYTQVDVKFK